MGRWLLGSLIGLWACGGSVAVSPDASSDVVSDVVADASVQDVVQARMGCASQVAAGSWNTCAIDLVGSLWCWGSNGLGQLGIGVVGGTGCSGDGCVMSPTRVAVLGTGVTSVSVGRYHACAVKQDRTAWCWGWNQNGQLGDGTTTNQTLPVEVTGLTAVVAISAGVLDTCAVKDDGSIWCWGWNGVGQLGDGTTTDRHSPVQVASMVNAIEVVVGHESACARKTDGSGWCWGHNVWGELGNGTTSLSGPPGKVTALANNVLDVTASAEGDYACAADALVGGLYCWGLGAPGLQTDGGAIVDTPTEVQGVAGVIRLAAGTSTTCALRFRRDRVVRR